MGCGLCSGLGGLCWMLLGVRGVFWDWWCSGVWGEVEMGSGSVLGVGGSGLIGGCFHFWGESGSGKCPKWKWKLEEVPLGGKVEVPRDGRRGEPGGQLPHLGHLKTTHAYR